MIAPDTNLLVRVITRDDRGQAERAADVLRSGPLWLSKTVILETEWVLRHAYGLDRDAVQRALRTLAGLSSATVEDAEAVTAALAWHAKGVDLADALHLASAPDSAEFVTFDRSLATTAAKISGAPEVRLLSP